MTHSVLPIAPEVEVIEKTFAALKSRVPQQRALKAKERIARLDALYNECGDAAMTSKRPCGMNSASRRRRWI